MGYIREEPSYNIKETLISRQCNRRSPSSEYVTCGVTPTDLRGLANLCGFLATENYKSLCCELLRIPAPSPPALVIHEVR